MAATTTPGEETAPGWAHFPHRGDVGVRGFGADMAGAFENAARAMAAVVAPLEIVKDRERVEIAVEAPDPEFLLHDWLNALIYEMATRRMLFADFRVRIAEGRLTGEARGEPIDPARHEPSVELKGATLSELHVGRDPDGRWQAQCVIDV
ncbi:MAG: archease [Pseudomonadota bacterium]